MSFAYAKKEHAETDMVMFSGMHVNEDKPLMLAFDSETAGWTIEKAKGECEKIAFNGVLYERKS